MAERERAEVIDWNPAWNAGAPMPQVFASNGRLFLVYLLDEPDPAWDGTYVRSVDPAGETNHPLAIVEFDNCIAHRFGMFNDEVMGAHPLCKRGLEYYRAHRIDHSTWLEEIKNIHRSHRHFDERRWADYRHFFLFFHDEMLEVIASSYNIETRRTTFREVAAEIAGRLNG